MAVDGKAEDALVETLGHRQQQPLRIVVGCGHPQLDKATDLSVLKEQLGVAAPGQIERLHAHIQVRRLGDRRERLDPTRPGTGRGTSSAAWIASAGTAGRLQVSPGRAYEKVAAA